MSEIQTKRPKISHPDFYRKVCSNEMGKCISCEYTKNIVKSHNRFHKLDIKEIQDLTPDEIAEYINSHITNVEIYTIIPEKRTQVLCDYLMVKNPHKTFKSIDKKFKTPQMIAFAIATDVNLLEFAPRDRDLEHVYFIAIEVNPVLYKCIPIEFVKPEHKYAVIRSYKNCLYNSDHVSNIGNIFNIFLKRDFEDEKLVLAICANIPPREEITLPELPINLYAKIVSLNSRWIYHVPQICRCRIFYDEVVKIAPHLQFMIPYEKLGWN